MKRVAFTLLCVVSSLIGFAQNKETSIKTGDLQAYREQCQNALQGEPFTNWKSLSNEPFSTWKDLSINNEKNMGQTSTKMKAPRRAPEEEQAEFIFDPEGKKSTYVMSLYSWSTKNSKFTNASCLLSQVRYAEDGKTVYFKDLTKSLGVITWLKGEKRVMEHDSLEVGIHKGDTIIDVPFGQPLVYYQAKYLVFFAPMKYTDNTGETEVQDNYTLIQRGDSLVQPTYPEGIFQAAVGYVFISEKKQGLLSLDIDHNMRLEHKSFAEVPNDVEPVEYVYSFVNSYGNIYKKKVNVKKKGDELYMQLSTSAPDSYVKGTLHGSEIEVESGQLVTDSTFLLYYSLADPVYENDSIVDFVPTKERRLMYDTETRSIYPIPSEGKYGGKNTFSVDYLEDMEMCMDYITDPHLTVYAGDQPVTPADPIIRSVMLDGDVMSMMTFNYISFVVPALDVDSNYINPDLITYRLFVNDTLYNFSPSVYKNLKEETTEMPYYFQDGFDFFVYDQLHYVYLWQTKDEVKSLGVQSIYTVNGEKHYSKIVSERFGTDEDDPSDTRKQNYIALTCRLQNPLVKAEEKLLLLGTVDNVGKLPVYGYTVSYTLDGQAFSQSFDTTIKSGKNDTFKLELTLPDNAVEGTPIDLNVTASLGGGIDDENLDNNMVALTCGVYTESIFKPIVLLEEFTAESCGWCPYGAWRIHTAIEEANLQDDVVWLCHHEGYGMDWLTVEASTTYTELYGGNLFAPAWMLDRNQQYGDEDYPVFGIGEVSELKNCMAEALKKPCFVQLNVENEYQNGLLTINVEAQKATPFDVACQSPRLTVLLVEDSLKSKKQKSYDSHSIDYHHNALRAVVTDVWGEAIEWNGDHASTTYTFQVPEDYNVRNLTTIAFVHEMKDDINQRRIFNTGYAPVPDPTSITEVIATPNTHQTANTASYNLQGQRVEASYKGLVIKNGRITTAR